MKRTPRQRLLLIHCPMGSLEPPPGYFSLGYLWALHLSLSSRLNRYIRTDIFEDDDPIGILLVNRCPEMERERARDFYVLRKRIGHISQFLCRPRLGKRHLSKTIRGLD